MRFSLKSIINSLWYQTEPLVMVRERGEDFERGTIVHKVRRGQQHSHGHTTGRIGIPGKKHKSRPYIRYDEFTIPLSALLDECQETGITYKNGKFFKNGKERDSGATIDELLDYHALNQIPPEVREQSSRVSSSRVIIEERGIAFDTLEELAAALRLYETGDLKSSKQEERGLFLNLLSTTGNPNIAYNAWRVITDTDSATSEPNLTDRIIDEFSQRTQYRYHRFFDYEASGTAFLKTHVTIYKSGEAYILELQNAGDPEIELAKIFEKERVLRGINMNYALTPTEGDWYRVDLTLALDGITTQEQASTIAGIAASELSPDRTPTIAIPYDGVKGYISAQMTGRYDAALAILRAGNKIFARGKGENATLSIMIEVVSKPGSQTMTPEDKMRVIERGYELGKAIQHNLSHF